MLAELKCSRRDRGRLDIAFKEAIDARGVVGHLISRIEVEIADLEPSVEAKEVEEAIRGFFEHEAEIGLRVPLT